MLKHFLATSALATLLATGLHAQTAPATDPAADPAAPIVEGTEGEATDAPMTDDTMEAAPDAMESAPPDVVQDDSSAPDATPEPEVVQDEPATPDAMTEPEVVQDEPAAPDATATPEVAEEPMEDAADTMTADGDWAPIDLATMSTDQLIGADIVTTDDETIATIEDVLITDDGQVENLVARFGGFLGFGANQVLLTVDEVEVMQDANDALIVRTSLTPESIEGRPVYEAEAEDAVME